MSSKLTSAALLASAAILVATTAHADPSRLWGRHGELWDPRGRLPDFSHAGYHAGEAPLPEPPVVANVMDFGAVADGLTDDSAAFNAAIAAAENGAVLVPAGRYRIRGVIRIDKSNVVLRGEGAGATGTVLDIDVSLADLFGARIQWAFSGGFIRVEPQPAAVVATAVRSRTLRGDRMVTVTSTAGLSAGQRVDLVLHDDNRGSLGRHMHNDRASAGTCGYQVPYSFRWPVTIDRIDGRQLTFSQGFRTEIRSAWQPELTTRNELVEVGIEHLRLEFPDIAYTGHLNEPGYNGIFMINGVADSWIRNVTFVNADSGIFVDRYNKHITITGVRTEGRMGHHGIQAAFAHDMMITDFDLRSDWVHALSVDHRASGNVFTNGSSTHLIDMDHHRDAPIENLFASITSTAGFRSSGSPCAGPHSGARSTFWNLAQRDFYPLWSDIQTTIIDGQIGTDERLDADAEWYEQVDNLEPTDLPAAQRERRLAFEAGQTRFSDGPYGDRARYSERNPERWVVWNGEYFLATSLYTAIDGALGEISIHDDGTQGDVRISARVRSPEFAAFNDDADFALVLSYGPNDYDFASFGPSGGLFRVSAGQVARLATATIEVAGLSHNVWFERSGDRLSMGIGAQELVRVSAPSRGAAAIGIGSFDDAAWFEDVRVESASVDPPDAGVLDAGSVDLGVADAGRADVSAPTDAGTTGADVDTVEAQGASSECGCATNAAARREWPAALVIMLGVTWASRRKKSG